MTGISYAVRPGGTVDEAVARLEQELKSRGFGILANLRVHDLLKEKIGAAIEPVVLLDVCSPRMADKALKASRDVALLLPCKIVVSREEGHTRVALLRPTSAMGLMSPPPALLALAEEVETQLIQAVDATATPHGAGSHA